MSPALLAGALAGLGLGTGLWLVLLGAPVAARPSLDARLAPHLRDAPRASRLLGAEPGSTGWRRALGGGPGGLLQRPARWLVERGPSTAAVRRRLQQAGSAGSVEQFRAEQVLCAAAGAAAGLGLSLLLAGAAGSPAALAAALVAGGACAGALGRDALLTRAVTRREERLLAELPTVAELLALSVGAGEGAVGALDRVARTCRGELSRELAATLAEARGGVPLVQALQRMGARTSAPSLARFVEGVAVAVERGTPLAEVLQAQAQDARQLGRRRLMEQGGRKEIEMLVPVIFLVLPVTVLFAVYPGLAVLRLGP